MVGATNHHYPIKENSEVYKEFTAIYIRLARFFTEEYESITAFQKKYVH